MTLAVKTPFGARLETQSATYSGLGSGVRLASSARRGEFHYLVDIVSLEAVVQWRPPTPLPGASSAVAGVFFHAGSPCTALEPGKAFGSKVREPPRYWMLVRSRGHRWALAADELRTDVVVPKLVELNPIRRGDLLAAYPVNNGERLSWWLVLDEIGVQR